MFEDIIGTKKKPSLNAELEKNGEVVENAVLDLSEYMTTYIGYITCPDLEVTEEDGFFLNLKFKNKEGKEWTRGVQIVVEKESYGRFKFTIVNEEFLNQYRGS